jgi:hypothetical protein
MYVTDKGKKTTEVKAITAAELAADAEVKTGVDYFIHNDSAAVLYYGFSADSCIIPIPVGGKSHLIVTPVSDKLFLKGSGSAVIEYIQSI